MNHSLSHLLNRCRNLASLRSIHARLLIDSTINSSDLALNKILRLYFRFGGVDYARKVFESIPQPNSFLWTSLIHGYVENHLYNESLALFSKMRVEFVEPLNFTICSVIKGLSRQTRLLDGEAVYSLSLKYGFGNYPIVQNAMLDLYMRCEKVQFAEFLFCEMLETDLVSWNTMISGYVNNCRLFDARKMFDKMSERNVISWTSMICGYVKSGNMEEALNLFNSMPDQDMASCIVMISGFIDAGDLNSATVIFNSMKTRDIRSWNIMISGFFKAGDVKTAEDYFAKMPKRNVASWTIMIDGYIKSEDTTSARKLFDQMPDKKNLVAWSSMIGGYSKNGQPHSALQLFECFKNQNIRHDETFVFAIISACSALGVSDAAEFVIDNYIGPSLFSNLRLVTSMIDMYAKCGNIQKAFQIFKTTNQRDLLCYSTMIVSFANHGMNRESIALFDEMIRAGVKPDGVSFLGLLTACNHVGLVEEGKEYFKRMIEEFGILPSEKHFAIMVSLLGRVGSLDEAHMVIRTMPMEPTSVVWGALLAACAVHRSVRLAEIAAEELFKIEPDNSGNYILLANVYSARRQWGDVARIRSLIRENMVKKNLGSSWIEIGCVVHEFAMGDSSHKDMDELYSMLELVNQDMMFFRKV
ncbi:pentatricopeptide repeat-containing protein At4g02750-like [Impatiens glandulifera]|uniref:pentatricopeptide repeat-containing protein At4g02750-like n=1 Tax=Impatiens glandulifera TaxID=253017 RepID=UPI001FB14ACD|nr:pentatricopeptide repeat-containing protein At4g02750-like [Impatiens glandulifera]